MKQMDLANLSTSPGTGRVVLSIGCALLAGQLSFGQTCKTATISSYDCGAPNPVTLRTLFPGQYPVLGTSMLVEAQGALPGSAAYLVLGLAG